MWMRILVLAFLGSLWLGHHQGGWIGFGLIILGLLIGFIYGGWSMLEMLEKEMQKSHGISAKLVFHAIFVKNEQEEKSNPTDVSAEKA